MPLDNIEETPSENQTVETPTIEPTRAVASGWDEIDRLEAEDENPQAATQAIAQQKKTDKDAIMKHYVNSLPEVDKALMSLATAPAGLAEDVYNTGVDAINHLDKKFGDGENLLEHSEIISRVQPDGTGYDLLHEATKFGVGYSAILKGVKYAKPAIGFVGEAGAGLMADFVTVQPQMESLLSNFIKKVPGVGEPVYEYLNDPTNTELEKRAKFAFTGILEAGAIEGVFKAIKHLGKLRASKKALDAPIAKQAAEAGEGVKKAPEKVDTSRVEGIPTISKEEALKSAQKKLTKAEQELTKKQTINTVDAEGKRVYMNLSQMGSVEAKTLITNMVESNPGKFSREVLTDAERRVLAREQGMKPKEFVEWTKEMGLKEGDILAAGEMTEQVAEAASDVLRKFDAGEISLEQATKSYSTAEKIISQFGDVRSLSGSLLHEANIPLKKKGENISVMRDLIQTYGDDVEAAAQALKNSEKGFKGLVKAIKTKMIMPVGDRIIQMRYASMLSNPFTHIRNIGGSTGNTILRPMETLGAATINAIEATIRPGMSRKDGVQFSEAYHETMGLYHGFLDSLAISYDRMKGKPAKFKGVDPNKTKLPTRLEETYKPADSSLGKVMQFIDRQGIQGRWVGDTLMFEDNFAKNINAHMTGRREAYRKEAQALAEGMSKEEALLIRNTELTDPSHNTLRMMNREAELATLTNDVPEGWLKVFETMSTAHPVGKLVAPFARTNLNAVAFKLERIPVMNMLVSSARKNMFHANPRVRQMQQAKMLTASTTLSALGFYLHSEDAITGNGPKEKGKWRMFEQAGYREKSIKVGGEWIPYGDSPLGQILGMVADIAQITDLADGDDTFVNGVGTAFSTVAAEAFNPEYLTDSVGKLFQALSSSDVKAVKSLLFLSSEIASSFAPYTGAFRAYTRELTEEGKIKRETFTPNSVLQTTRDKILSVYAPNELATKRNILGYPMMHKSGLGPLVDSPYGVNKETDNPVIQELARLAGAKNVVNPINRRSLELGHDDDFISVAMPPKILNQQLMPGSPKTTELDMVEYEKLVLYSAGMHPKIPKSLTLERSLTRLFKDEKYKKLPFGLKGVAASKVIRGYQTLGKALYNNQPANVASLRASVDYILQTLDPGLF